MIKTSRKPNNWLLIVLVAGIALALGILLKGWFSSTGLAKTENAAVQAKQDEVIPAVKNTAIPTAVSTTPQYVPVSQSQNEKGLKFTASNFRFADNHIYVDVCYDLPGNDVWDINSVTLQYGNKSTPNFGLNETLVNVVKDGKSKGNRCATLDFYDLEKDSDFSTLTISNISLGQVPPMEGRECEGFSARLKASPKIAAAGIEVACEGTPGSFEMKVKKKSSTLTDDEANQLMSDVMYGTVTGPWSFTVTLNP